MTQSEDSNRLPHLARLQGEVEPQCVSARLAGAVAARICDLARDRCDRAGDPRCRAMERGASVRRGPAGIVRIRAVRNQMLLGIDFEQIDTNNLKRLVSLDRYERCVHTRRRRALSNLRGGGPMNAETKA
jgi:hypothetical protein